MALPRSPELLRARYRLSIFLVYAPCCYFAGGRASLAAAAAGLVLALVSMRVAATQGDSLALTFVTLDWLALGAAVALGGGIHSWLLAAVPPLMVADLAPAQRRQRAFLLTPAAAVLAVLLIADPSLGGTGLQGLLRFTGLVVAGAAPALLLRPPKRRRRPGRTMAPAADAATGFCAVTQVAPLLGAMLHKADAAHEPVGVVCVRLNDFSDTVAFLGQARAEAVLTGAARNLRQRLRPGDLAFRVSADTFLLALYGRTPAQTRAESAGMGAVMAVTERRRQTFSTGVAAYPPAPDLESLLREAQADLQRAGTELRPAAAL